MQTKQSQIPSGIFHLAFSLINLTMAYYFFSEASDSETFDGLLFSAGCNQLLNALAHFNLSGYKNTDHASEAFATINTSIGALSSVGIFSPVVPVNFTVANAIHALFTLVMSFDRSSEADNTEAQTPS
jgi:hypothetical protein